MAGIRAQDPPTAPPPFDPPKLCDGRRTAGNVQVPDPASEDAGPLEMSWKVASAGALVEPSPTKLRRTSSIAGNILVAEGNDSKKKSYWLQRKITEGTHSHNYVRIGFPLQNVTVDGEEKSNAWTVCKAEEGSMYPFDMVAIKVQSHSQVFPDEDDDEDEAGTKEGDDDNLSDTSARLSIAANARNEISALQLIKEADPDGKGNVLRAELVVDDQLDVYAIMPYCKEGTLMDLVSSKNGRLEEAEARKYFSNTLNGLETLQIVKLCHRNICLENVLIRGEECHISSLGLSLRIPVSPEDGTVLKITPQAACGKKPEYIAPEAFQNEPFDGYAVDLWSCGVMLCLMLFGSDVIFSAPIREDPKFQEICVHGHLKTVADKVQALVPDQTPVSDEAIDLLQSLLRVDPADRLTLAEVKEHPWVKAG